MADFSRGIAYIDGGYHEIRDARIPIQDWGFLRSDANQDTVTVWRGAFFRLDDHLARFARNIERLRMATPETAEDRRRIAIDCVRRTGLRDAYVQLVMTRGRPQAGVRDVRRVKNRFIIFCVPYIWIVPPAVKEKGLHLHVSERWRVPPESVDPTIKHYHWLDFEMGLFDAYDRGADTVILSDRHGNVTEGPGFNIFLVKDGGLRTPDSGVLDGMTRRTVQELADSLQMPCRLEPVAKASLPEADEIFLSSSAGGIFSVTRLDGAPVGAGEPGPLTTRLESLYWEKRAAGWHATPVDYGTA